MVHLPAHMPVRVGLTPAGVSEPGRGPGVIYSPGCRTMPKITGGRVKDRTVEVLPQPLLDKIAVVATVRHFPKRAIIVIEGDDTDSLYVMLSGKARVFVADDKGREVQLNQMGPGEYFGEITLDGGPRSASVMASPFFRRTLSTWFGTRRPWAS